MKRLNRNSLLTLVLSCLVSMVAQAQINAVVYVDLSDQSNRSQLMAKVDSVLAGVKGEELLYISNAATPLVFQDSDLGRKETSNMSTLDPSLPNPYFDLDSLIKLSYAYDGFSKDLKVYFFISYQQAVKGEKHLNNIAEKYLLSLGLAEKPGAHKKHAVAFINTDGDKPSAEKVSDFLDKYSTVYQLKVY